MFSAKSWGQEQKNVLASFWTPKRKVLKFQDFLYLTPKVGGQGQKNYSTSNFQCKKLEAKQKTLFSLFWNSQA